MDDVIAEMIRLAHTTLPRAYAPYSGYHVAACLRSAGGGLFTGVNVENAAFPSGVCAESSAICQMVAAGEQQITDAVILAHDDKLCPPCGNCRQRLQEFSTAKTRIHLCNRHGILRTCLMQDLLPMAFDFTPVAQEKR